MLTPLTASSSSSAAASERVAVGADEDPAGPVGHRVPDGVVVARGGQPAAQQDDLTLGQPLDLVQHVGADDDRAPLAAQALEERDEVRALHRVGAVERLVEHEDGRLADERGGDLGALAHALAEAVDPPVGDVEQADGLQRAVGRGADRSASCSRAT